MTGDETAPIHDDMTGFERAKAREAWAELPDDPSFDDYLQPVGEYDTPAYVNFPRIRRRFATRRARFLEAEYDIPWRYAFALAARHANCNQKWVAEELGVRRATVGSYFDDQHDELGRAILTEDVPPTSVNTPLVVDLQTIRECPECGDERVLSLDVVDDVFPDTSPDFTRAIEAARARECTHICSTCHTPQTKSASEATDEQGELP